MKELSLQNCRIDGRYDVQSKLGRGSYAEIYLARDILASTNSLHSLVVIKALNVFLQDDLDSDLERTLVENFQNEAVALDRVRHPNIISRLGHGTARDLHGTVFHYLILEYLPGGDLSKLRSTHGLTIETAFDYLEQICAGLSRAHSCGVIHRDIKPQNLLLTADRKTVKIADFGVARFAHNDAPITRVGTNMYAPPEHSPVFSEDASVVMVSELTPAADVYSLAKSAYVLITGESPRRFTNLPIGELPSSFSNKSWAGSLLRVLTKATQNSPGERFQTVNEFWRALAEVKISLDQEDPETETRVSRKPALVPQPAVIQGFKPEAPELPKFDTSENFKVPMSDEKNPHFVVRIGDEESSKGTLVSPPLNEKNQMRFDIPPQEEAGSSFFKRIGILVLLVSVFAAALFATQNYLRYGRILPSLQNSLLQNEGIANSDVNIRSEGNVDSPRIGLVPRGSKVRIRQVKDNWMEIDIIEFGRPKENAGDRDRGWVNGRYITVQE
jgi:serine/threonine protein kinase